MRWAAAMANTLWWATHLPAWRSYRHALNDPAYAQAKVLQSIISRAKSTAFGQAHHFDRIRTYADFRARVPLHDYQDLEPWIARIREGEQRILTMDRVTRLATTGGTTSARKLIPYTHRLQAEFNRAIGPWIAGLFHSDPSLMWGSAYWSISPVERTDPQPSAVPIGFEDDSEYLGGMRKRLVDAVMAVPSHVRHATTMDEWRQLTTGYLSNATDLRLISVWHPSFLTLLLEHIPHAPQTMWPRLRLISCWADAQATLAADELRCRFPHVVVQPKGLIATEGIVSIPFAGRWPLAIRSHFLEFIDDAGDIWRAHELRAGQTYEVILTTSGGLYRYRLHDRIRVDGFVGATPSIRFLGRAGNVSDRFGEKLSEAFVGQVIDKLRAEHRATWRFAMLAPDCSRYVLYIEGHCAEDLDIHIDQALRQNPHYAYCRDLGQLLPPGAFCIEKDAASVFIARLAAAGQRLGNIKPTALSQLDDWHQHFTGYFVVRHPDRRR